MRNDLPVTVLVLFRYLPIVHDGDGIEDSDEDLVKIILSQAEPLQSYRRSVVEVRHLAEPTELETEYRSICIKTDYKQKITI